MADSGVGRHLNEIPVSTINVNKKDNKTVITIQGSFVFDVNKAFREAYADLPKGRPVTVDLSRADYIDSAGLGMLLRLREHLGNEKHLVRLTGGNDTIRTILNVANFGQLFRID